MKDPADTVTGELDVNATERPAAEYFRGYELEAEPAVFTATVTIKRAATGKTETYELTGTPLKDDTCL